MQTALGLTCLGLSYHRDSCKTPQDMETDNTGTQGNSSPDLALGYRLDEEINPPLLDLNFIFS